MILQKTFLKNIKNKIQNYWVKFLVLFDIPLPLSNCYYEGIRIRFKKNWFCRNCCQFFNTKPEQDKMIIWDIRCPNCGSGSIYAGTAIFKAKIDNKPIEEVLKICDLISRYSTEPENRYIILKELSE